MKTGKEILMDDQAERSRLKTAAWLEKHAGADSIVFCEFTGLPLTAQYHFDLGQSIHREFLIERARADERQGLNRQGEK